MANNSLSSEALTEYVGEAEEILRRVSEVLSSLERGAKVADHIDGLYRDVHTLKGSSQLFGFGAIGQLAHGIEACLSPIRKHQLAPSPILIDSFYHCLDLIESMVKSVSSGQSDFSSFQSDLNTNLSALIEAGSKEFGGDYFSVNEGWMLNESQVVNRSPKERETVEEKHLKVMTPKEGVLSEAVLDEPKSGDRSGDAKQDSRKESQGGSGNTAPGATGAVDTTIRVQVELLDRLMNLAGELVLVRNQVLQHANRSEDFEFLNLSQSLDLVTSELQGEVMKTRMQPIGNVVSKFQRVVRDLARDLGKKIDLTLQGTETELDKTLLEAIKDPLTHLVRNSCDHGVETTEERLKVGKPETGHVLIRSYHEGGQVVIEISDDGKGLDKDKLVAKALEKGLITQEKANKLTEREIFNLIFLPGFSTAQQVSAVSGRGVGMDVVRTNIEKIGGNVDLSSRLGKGTTIKLKIPLTLAIVPALIVKAGSDRFAIPQVKLVELVRVESKDGTAQIEYLQKKPMYRLRGSLLPLVVLREVLNQTGVSLENTPLVEANIVVLSGEGGHFGLVVDEILDTTDIVVKPLSQFLKSLNVFSGATIMGDGSVSLILDIAGVAEKTNLISTSQKKDDGFSDLAATKRRISSDVQEFLLFRLQNQGVHAIPLCLVHRLEEFQKTDVELSGEQRVVQYRNSILPLIYLNSVLKYQQTDTEIKSRDTECIVVIQRSGRLFGIVVDEILDVVVVESTIDDTIRDREGVLGNLLHDEQVLVVVDALRIIELECNRLGKKESRVFAAPDVSGVQSGSISELERLQKEQSKRVRLLFVEDVAFFRRQVSKVLISAGYEVTTAENGVAALRLLEKSGDKDFAMVLSDIEMPEMSGLELARAIRKHDRFSTIPLVALTTRFRDSDIREGKQAGFNMYLEKLNEERLLKCIDTVLGHHPEQKGA